MDKNMDLSIGFKGCASITAQAVPLQEGYLKLGGIAGENLSFGIVVSADPNDPDVFKAGCQNDNIVRGICVFDDAIAQNAPAHPNAYLETLPCAALNHGFVWISKWKKDASGAIEPAIGCKVIFKKDSGEIEFIASSSSAPSDWAELAGASVRMVDSDDGALIYLN